MTSLIAAAVVQLLAGCSGATSTASGTEGAADPRTAGRDVPGPSGAQTSCAASGTGWIWCDDFEVDRLGRYFEYNSEGGRFARVGGAGRNGSYGMRARFSPGTVDAGNLKLAFGRTPGGPFRAVDGGAAHYRDVYWRVWTRSQAGWRSGPDIKMSRAIVFAGANWSQAAIGHVWSGGAGGNYLLLDPASGTDAAGNVRTTRYNDFPNLRWLGQGPGRTPLFATSHSGAWHCVEAHMRLNDPGETNGLFELWIDGKLDAVREKLNWLGGYDEYGINAVFLENWWNTGSQVEQERYFDEFVVSTRRIGC